TAVDAARRVLRVSLQNPTAAELPLQVVARQLSWQEAPVRDELRTVSLPPRGTATVEIPFPRPDATAYQELDFRDAYVVRLGLLSGDGRRLLHESRVPVDLRPPVQLDLQVQEERTRPYPFNAPPPGKGFRLGLQLGAYSFK